MNYEKEMRLLHLTQQVYSSLISVSNKLQTAGDKYCTPFTSRQYMTVLAILHLPEEETTIVNIANKLGSTKQNITQLVSSLEKKGSVAIGPSKKDKRAVNVCVTELGMQTMLSCAGKISVDLMADLFADFDEKELELLWRLQKKLYAFDGVAMDGLEENVKVPFSLSEQEIQTALERFSQRRNNPMPYQTSPIE
ncbi:MarR family winged helix-turn-helix transcriptional regulator [Clostridium merdae]|uniref:MarR family winged helix-turn-helix transcriptional regulator n=1 Tax=Clostridium merdae TaxID=1958780 RepID=UPI000A271CA7|nr:MarR family transcriptional regulator [Clostridium merdae]